jgi:hypothetical protein
MINVVTFWLAFVELNMKSPREGAHLKYMHYFLRTQGGTASGEIGPECGSK